MGVNILSQTIRNLNKPADISSSIVLKPVETNIRNQYMIILAPPLDQSNFFLI